MLLSSLSIIFFGTPHFAEQILRNLNEKNVPIKAVFTQPDRTAGRDKKLKSPAVKIYAEENNLEVFQFSKFDEEATKTISSLEPDLFIVAAYGLILPPKILSLPKFGAINIHGSLLPKLRGASPIQSALLEGMQTTGITIMLMNEKTDAGDILAQKEIPIDPQETAATLENKMIKASNDILIPTIENWINKELSPRSQDNTQASFSSLISKQDGKIIWANDAEQIYRQYQAYFKWPKIYCYWEQEIIQNIEKKKKEQQEKTAESADSFSFTPPAATTTHKKITRKITFLDIEINNKITYPDKKFGEVFQLADGSLAIQTSKGVVIPKTILLEGKKPTAINDFINGYPDFINTVLI
jgi:methionyl-tRNA formyltransferase